VSTFNNAVKGRKYKHYKGDVYTVITLAQEEATQNPVVVYEAANGTVWTRPSIDFFGYVDVDGVSKQRFELLPVGYV
jgi:hypothetical protein